MKVLVLMGGTSTEREVSLRSGATVSKALSDAGYEVKTLDINPGNINEIAKSSPDVVYIALHGKGGEDGTIQGLLEYMQIPYTGPGVAASVICMDKILTKEVLVANGINTPKFLIYDKYTVDTLDVDKIVADLGLPIVIKAACQGSSIGVEIIYDKNEIKQSVERNLTFDNRVLLEQYVEGTEVTVPILGNEDLTVLPIIEIVSDNKFYDFQSKYTPGKSKHIIPANITDYEKNCIEQEAKRAYKCVGCTGLSRIDFIIDKNGTPFVIEINTIPGMTETSLFPDAAKHIGLSLPDLVSKIINLAFKK